MQNQKTLENYEQYLNLISNEIDKMFENQKEYICCKNGCSLCCEQGMYPFSEVEFEYIKQEYESLSSETKEKIREKVDRSRSFAKQGEFLYECPFLVNGSCAVYQKRGLICRTFGLISENASGKLTIPYCAEKGLNYSGVFNPEEHRIFEDKVKELGYSEMPRAYNLSRYNLMYGIVKSLNFEWGESKLLIDWLVDYLQPLD